MDNCVKCYLEDNYSKCKDKVEDPTRVEPCFWYNVVKNDLKKVFDYNAGKEVPLFEGKPCTTFDLDDLVIQVIKDEKNE